MADLPFKTLAIIPARGGSKGVPRKNIRPLDGKPLIAYTIETALQSKGIDRCIVNTDDDEIAFIAQSFGAEVMMRAAGQGEDQSPVLPVVLDTLEYANTGKIHPYNLLILLQPTSPLRTPTDIDNVIKMLSNDASPDGVISVIEVGDGHPARMYRIDDSRAMKPLDPNAETMRRQDLPPVYLRNGCIYAVRVDALLREQTLMVKNKQAYIMPAEWTANIDTERDFLLAGLLMKQWKQAH